MKFGLRDKLDLGEGHRLNFVAKKERKALVAERLWLYLIFNYYNILQVIILNYFG